MTEIHTGISVLKKINSLLKGKVNSSRIPVVKNEQVSASKQIKSTSGSGKVITSEIRFYNGLQITGVKDKKIQELVCQRLTCEKALNLKQEIENFSTAWISRLV
ncbi:MAG TPA: hypothetical protein VMT04_06665 [Terriglobales bacterium]|nr:hypothetical protein [Terriglobales bacterium]